MSTKGGENNSLGSAREKLVEMLAEKLRQRLRKRMKEERAKKIIPFRRKSKEERTRKGH